MNYRSNEHRRGPIPVVLTIAMLSILSLSLPMVSLGDVTREEGMAPDADAGDDIISGVLPWDTVQLDGSRTTDEDIDNCTFVWTCTSHPSVVIDASADRRRPTFEPRAAGDYTIELLVTDPEDLTDTDSVQVTVSENQRPRAVIMVPSQYQVFVKGTPVEFNASTSNDPDGRPITFRWESNVSGFLSDKAAFTRVFIATGLHLISLNVSDPNGGHDIEEIEIRIRDPPAAPIARIAAMGRDYRKGETIVFDATPTTDPNPGETLNFTWTSDMGPTVIGYGMVLRRSLPEGSHNVTLNVTDRDGLSNETSVRVDVENRRPAARIEGPAKVNVSEAGTFTADLSSDPDGDELSYHWDLGDNTTATGPTVQHSWANWGRYNVTLTVDDGSMENALSEAVLQVRVNSIPVPVIDPEGEPQVGERFYMTANGTVDPDGDKLVYRWDLDEDGVPETQGYRVDVIFEYEDSYMIVLEVTDGFATARTEITVEARIPNEVPFANAGPDLIVALNDDRGEVEIDGGLSFDPDDDVDGNGIIDGRERDNLTYSWDLDITKDTSRDGIPDNDVDKKGKVVRFTISGSGPITVALNVTDKRGAWSRDLVMVRGNTPPTITTYRSTPSERTIAGVPVTFEASGRDTERDDVSFSWQIEENVRKTGSRVTHVFTVEGTYEIILVATDGLMNTTARLQMFVEELPGPRVLSPSNGTRVSGVVVIRGTADEAAGTPLTGVEISINGGPWSKCKGNLDWSTWEYEWNTKEGMKGRNTIVVRAFVDKQSTVVYASTTVYLEVGQDSSSSDQMMTLLPVIAIVVLLLITVLFFILRKKRDIAPPPMAGPGGPPMMGNGYPPAQQMPRMSNPPMPAPAAQRPAAAPAPPQQRTIRIKCPACGGIFVHRDTGERPIHLVCDHCGVKGTIDAPPDGIGSKEPEEKEDMEEHPDIPQPIPIVCPNCSGLFEISEKVDSLICPFCEAEGELDEETAALISERFGPEVSLVTLKCPKCSATFEVKDGSETIECPKCGVHGKF